MLNLRFPPYAPVTPFKKRGKMVSCGAPGCTNRANKNSKIITLVTVIMMFL